jgi:hypothetical protein
MPKADAYGTKPSVFLLPRILGALSGFLNPHPDSSGLRFKNPSGLDLNQKSWFCKAFF